MEKKFYNSENFCLTIEKHYRKVSWENDEILIYKLVVDLTRKNNKHQDITTFSEYLSLLDEKLETFYGSILFNTPVGFKGMGVKLDTHNLIRTRNEEGEKTQETKVYSFNEKELDEIIDMIGRNFDQINQDINFLDTELKEMTSEEYDDFLVSKGVDVEKIIEEIDEEKELRIHSDDIEDIGDVSHYKGIPFNGIIYDLHPNGKLGFEGKMINGRMNGECKDYDEFGLSVEVGNYIDDKKDGEFIMYGIKKNIILISFWKNDKQVGTWKYYTRKGKLMTEEEYQDGELINKKEHIKW